MPQEANTAIHINERIAYYGIKVCQTMSDSSGVELLAMAGIANRRRDNGEGEARWPDAALPHGAEETESLVRKRRGSVAREHGVVGDHVPLDHPVEQPARVVEEAGAEERGEEDVVGEHVGPGGGGAQERDGGRGGAEAGVGGGEAVGEVRGAEEGAGAAEEAGVERRGGGAGGAAGEKRGGGPWGEGCSIGRGRGHRRRGSPARRLMRSCHGDAHTPRGFFLFINPKFFYFFSIFPVQMGVLQSAKWIVKPAHKITLMRAHFPNLRPMNSARKWELHRRPPPSPPTRSSRSSVQLTRQTHVDHRRSSLLLQFDRPPHATQTGKKFALQRPWLFTVR
jgi:hypothetical protein